MRALHARAAWTRLVALVVVSPLLAFGAGPDPAKDLAQRTVILVNAHNAESVSLGEFYREARGIPAENLVSLPMPDAESVTWREFVEGVWQPLQDELLRRKWLQGFSSEKRDAHGRRLVSINSHRIAFLVTCRGTPLRIHHDPAAVDAVLQKRLPAEFRTNQAAVDSELTLLASSSYKTLGYQTNPAFQAKFASMGEELLVKVSRLDGPSLESARNLVTSALTAERQGLLGRYYVDRSGPHREGDAWLESTRQLLDKLDFDGDSHDAAGMFGITDRFDAPVFYFGWYAGAINGPFLRDGFRFPPGAIALHIHSGSAGTLRTERQHWTGPLIARGAAATFGNVFEPYLQLTIRPNLLLQKLADGAVLGDAAYFATPGLSWQAIIIGDPLYRPFARSLDAQRSEVANLPGGLAGYVTIRRALALQKRGNVAAARTELTGGMRDHPSLALGLALAEFELAQRDRAAAVHALGFVKAMRRYSGEDWPLALAVARFVAKHGTAREAAAFYEALASADTPPPEITQAIAEDRASLRK